MSLERAEQIVLSEFYTLLTILMTGKTSDPAAKESERHKQILAVAEDFLIQSPTPDVRHQNMLV